MKTCPLLWIALFFCSASPVSGQVTYSREYNFSSPKIRSLWNKRAAKLNDPFLANIPTDIERLPAIQLRDFIAQDCQNCSLEVVTPGKWSPETLVKFNEGGGFKIAVDPAVIEVQPLHEVFTSSPTQAEVARRNYIFMAAKAVGLSPADPCHLNFGARSAFGDDAESFMRFLADWSNRPLSQGLLGDIDHIGSSPPMSYTSMDQQLAYKKLIAATNNGWVTSLKIAARRMNDEVYTFTPLKREGGLGARHDQEIGLKYLVTEEFAQIDQPIELRGLRHPQSAEEDYLLRELIDKRIAYLKSQKGNPIFYVPEQRLFEATMGVYLPWSLALHFRIYVAEMGLDWRRYQVLIPPKIRAIIATKKNKRIFDGDIDWDSPTEVGEFASGMAKYFYVSPWMEAHIYEILSRPELPVGHVAALLVFLQGEFEAAPEVLNTLLRKLARLPQFKKIIILERCASHFQ